MSDAFQKELAFLGIESSPAFVRAPEGNGCAERFIRTLKENLLWVRTFDTVEELRQALLVFREIYNTTWLIERHGFQTPAAVRQNQLSPAAWPRSINPVSHKPRAVHAGFAVAPTSYGKIGIPRFLLPFTWLRRKAIRRVASDIKTARVAFERVYGRRPSGMSVISHSFGTYVISRILRDHPEFEWKRIVFCGSVVREDFDLTAYWRNSIRRFSMRLGQRTICPRWPRAWAGDTVPSGRRASIVLQSRRVGTTG